MFKPSIEIDGTDEGNLKLGMTNMPVSIINSLRRAILTDIPTVVINCGADRDEGCECTTNTSRFTNEMIKGRLACIPVHLRTNDPQIEGFLKHAQGVINVQNDSSGIIMVTTNDIKLLDKNSGSAWKVHSTRDLFPVDQKTGDPIPIVRLRPSVGDNEGEGIKISFGFSISTPKKNASYAVASTCTYKARMDTKEVEKQRGLLIKELNSGEYTEEDKTLTLSDFDHSNALRIVLPDAFDFIVRSVGPIPNRDIMVESCRIMKQKIDKVRNLIHNPTAINTSPNTTIENAVDINLGDEDYTIGKPIQFCIHKAHIDTSSGYDLTYCGFNKPHPLIKNSIIRLAFKNKVETPDLLILIESVLSELESVYELIEGQIVSA